MGNRWGRLQTAALGVLGIGELVAVVVGGMLGVLSAIVWAGPAWIGWRRPTIGGWLLIVVSVVFLLILLAALAFADVSTGGAIAVLVVFCAVPLVAGLLFIVAATRVG